VFWNTEEQRLRAGWRILLQFALMALLGALPILLVAEPLTALHRRGLFLPHAGKTVYDRAINMIVGPLLTLGILASVAIATRFLDRRRVHLRLDARWWRALLLGLSLGAVLMTLIFAVELTAGWLAVASVAPVPLGLALAFSIVKVLCVGTYEEVVTRGYLLRNLAEGTNVPLAVAISSAIFAVLHATNDNATLLSIAGLFVNGVLFAAAMLVTGRLSASIGLHMAWNFCEGVVFGFPVSGDKEGASFVAIEQLGSPIVTGGGFGPEAGLIGVGACVVGIGLLVFARWIVARR
jgi:membrane protease YdiL (CAAX protease family)